MLGISGGTPRQTTDLLARLAGGTSSASRNAVYVAVVATVVTTVVVKRTVAGRRFEAVGANGAAAWATGLRVQRHRAGGYVGAQVLYWLGGAAPRRHPQQAHGLPGRHLPAASVAAVVLGGTSLLGGRGNLVATAVAALFLTQLDQFVLALGVDFAVQDARPGGGVRHRRRALHHRLGARSPTVRRRRPSPGHDLIATRHPSAIRITFTSARHAPERSTRMSRPTTALRLLAALGRRRLALTACGSSTTRRRLRLEPAAAGSAVAGAPSWCGSKKITLGLTDGFGGNSWRLVTTASAKDEIAKCPSVTDFTYADGQGDTQKAISDIQGLVAKGVNALVVFPDAGNAMLPALQSANQAGVMTVPYRVNPGGEDGKDYDVWVGADFVTDGKNWANWINKNLPDGGNILFLSGPAGNSQGLDELKGLEESLDPAASTRSSAQSPFEVTNWDPAKTQQVLSAAIAKYPKIDVIVSDFGPSLVGALPEFKKSGRSIPALATSDGNVLSCFWEDNKAKNPDFKLFTVATGNDNARLAVQ